MTWPAPTRSDHQTFCEAEGWEPVKNARGRISGHHALTYELALRDGRILRTRISHPVNADAYGANLWSHILRDQLDVDEETFWACVRDGKKPERGQPEPPGDTLPASLAHLLVTQLRLSSAEVAVMTRGQAIARMQEHWSKPPRSDQ